MSKRVIEFYIVDILLAIDKIERYSKNHTNAIDFYYDELSFDATMRELQIIGEATKKLINRNILSNNYRVIVDFRNLIVHEYFGIDADEIWDILKNELPKFKEVVNTLFLNANKKLLKEVLEANSLDLKNRSLEFILELKKRIKD